MIYSDEPLQRPGWRRAIGTIGRLVLIRILNEDGVEVSRVAINPQAAPDVAKAIALARTHVGNPRVVAHLPRRDGSYFTVLAERYHGTPAIVFTLRDADGSRRGKNHSITELDALERAIEAVNETRQEPRL